MSITVSPSTSTPPVLRISTSTQPINVTVPRGKEGPQGDPGPPGEDAKWASMTLAEYQALLTKDPNTLYVIIG